MGTTSYPGALDDFSTTSPTNLGDDDSKGRKHDERHDDMESAMEAVQTALGTDPKGQNASVKERLAIPFRGLIPAVGESFSSMMGQASGFNSAALNEMWAVPIWVPIAMTVDRIQISVTAAQASATPRLGIYANTAGTDKPGSLIVDGGTVSAASTGAKEVTVSASVPAGLNFVAIAFQGSITSLGLTNAEGYSFRIPTPSGGNAADATQLSFKVTGVSGALPGTFGTPSTAPNAPAVGLRRSA